ncbi:PPE domain-containing protein [Gordonia sp. SID5947]|uniref:PPE domain-containing protein n=1 Tax=Gordonia sp. SID5947 TaxID=2690315 RepID=UPI00136C2C51|nr:PPE domain-containing protein [Gordonia sp. SID5947]MYR07566.1 PPE domain-containing protein [Gordonia sp. SID5947]
MIVGFTGVIWEGRPAERLAHDLHNGLGPARMAESGAAWTAVAGELAEIGVEYGKILTELGVHWESHSYNHAFEKLMQFAPWFADAANQAVQTAAAAEGQAVATTVALTAMPNPVEIQATKAVQEALSHVHAAAGSPLIAAAANTERTQQDQKQRASRVMESYERASTPIEKPWTLPKPPHIVSEAALNAEAAAAREAAEKAKAIAQGTGIQAGLAMAPMFGAARGIDITREKSRYATTELAASGDAPTQLVEGTGSSEPDRSSGSVPMAAGAGAGAAAAGARSGDDEHRPASAEPTQSSAGASSPGVNLPAGWVQADQHDTEVSWSDIAGRYETPSAPTLPEGVLDLGDGQVSPAVLGAPDDRGRD